MYTERLLAGKLEKICTASPLATFLTRKFKMASLENCPPKLCKQQHHEQNKFKSKTSISSLARKFKTKFYKLIAILRRQYHIILTASWEKIYSVLGGVAKRRSPIRNIFSPNPVNIMWYCRLKIAISFVSRSIIYKDK